ncbi:MAG: ABC transporter substrate-binding protein [Bifidobacterium subtile]|jgi:ABC-type nitrate/sulfonate/bicarbonate transport system substrate-binding protein|uniref:ABC transporter substrate-binding protein n=1 Tax=Bifidobacterium subtile TaxID=77635 RepID=UPI002F351452|nr:ABC transporter substrate-binding protein [Bifidobacterium subtile]MCI1241110.1 ABC transporter substrate-binding protein [Bifidobacterium subtile]MCI1257881.1 ABC transporter substrate-binding protein [Bifidobacterium subtile]
MAASGRNHDSSGRFAQMLRAAAHGSAIRSTADESSSPIDRRRVYRQRGQSRLRTSLRAAFAALLCASLGLGAAACGSANDASSSGDATKLSFMLDWTPNTNHIGLYVAQKLGYFKDAGVNLTILPTAQAGAETSVENGVANVGFTTLSNVAAFNAQGAKLRFVFDLTQKPVAQWCALASRKDIVTPKDLSGKTFVSFGSAEQNAVVRQMIKHAGGTGEFKTATAGTNTFATLSSGKGDFGGFYATWEGVESKLNGPALNCFEAADWGVPGNPDQLGFAVNASWLNDSAHQATLRHFLAAAAKGYDYALANPQKASDILVAQTKESQLDPKLVRASMDTIIDRNYWTTAKDAKRVTGATDFDAAQQYLDFQNNAGTYASDKDKAKAKDGTSGTPGQAPQARKLATNDYLS